MIDEIIAPRGSQLTDLRRPFVVLTEVDGVEGNESCDSAYELVMSLNLIEIMSLSC